MLGAVLLWMRWSRRGIQMRAMMQDPQGAALVGVSVRTTGMMVLAISGALAGLSAVLLAATFFVNPQRRRRAPGEGPGDRPARRPRLDPRGASSPRSWSASAEALTSKYFGPQYALFMMYMLVFAVLVVRPRGIGGLLDEVRQ